MQEKARAPRLQAFLERGLGRTVIVMPRLSWNVLGVGSTNLVEIDARLTPVARVTRDASYVAVVANQLGPSDATVSVYRYDSSDVPKEWNTDHYAVWLDLENHPDIRELVTRASTSYNDNLVKYLRENVFWVREDHGDDHWLSYDQLPAVVQAVVNIHSRSS